MKNLFLFGCVPKNGSLRMVGLLPWQPGLLMRPLGALAPSPTNSKYFGGWLPGVGGFIDTTPFNTATQSAHTVVPHEGLISDPRICFLPAHPHTRYYLTKFLRR